jgi:hypothetical protein
MPVWVVIDRDRDADAVMCPSGLEGLHRLVGLFVLFALLFSLSSVLYALVGVDLDWDGGVVLAVGLPDVECAVWCQLDCPSGFVDEVVVPRADGEQVG